MIKYKTLCLAAVGIMATFGLNAAPGKSSRAVTQGKTDGDANGMQTQGQSGAPAMADCSAMSADEQQFSNQIMDQNLKMMFCNKFTPDQRSTAMQMMNQPDAQGNMMTSDQCVQKVMKDNNMMMPMMQQQKSGGTGGCPVKQ
ncbi:MAG TPA: hypothetical protein VJ112_01480 [Rhabdochlamydiaceae bacterium]|nr:hypothetical protein [Rhabdochlamydiaceae bacterium]